MRVHGGACDGCLFENTADELMRLLLLLLLMREGSFFRGIECTIYRECNPPCHSVWMKMCIHLNVFMFEDCERLYICVTVGDMLAECKSLSFCLCLSLSISLSPYLTLSSCLSLLPLFLTSPLLTLSLSPYQLSLSIFLSFLHIYVCLHGSNA